MAKKSTNDKPQTNPAVKAAQEILNLATRDEGKELTDAQQDKLFSKCEDTIRANVEGFYAVGVALEAIRRNDLYKLAEFKTFEAYCEARWSFGRARASQLIKAAGIVNICKQSGLPPPANEAQTRELNKLKQPEQQVKVWKQITDKSPLEEITAPKVAKAVAAKLKPKPAQKSKGETSSTTPEHKADESADDAGDESGAGAEEEAAADGDVVHDDGTPDETATDAVTDDEGVVVMMDEAAEVDEGGADARVPAYNKALTEWPDQFDDFVDHMDDIVGQAMDPDEAVVELNRIVASAQTLIEAEIAKAEALDGTAE